jgi:hypothetical protein
LEEKTTKESAKKSNILNFSQNVFENRQSATLDNIVFVLYFKIKFILPTENLQAVMWLRCVYPSWNPDPDFSPYRIQQQNKRGGKFVVLTFYGATNFTKLKIILFLRRYRKKFEPIGKEL